jgi:hypothetical protein
VLFNFFGQYPNAEEILMEVPDAAVIRERKWQRLEFKSGGQAGHRLLMPVILATPEAEMRRIVVPSWRGQIVSETLSGKSPSQKQVVDIYQLY